MRQKSESVLCHYWSDDVPLKIVAGFREKYKLLSAVLDAHREILDLAHRDLRKVSRGGRQGRKGKYTSENILRTLVVMQTEGLGLRDAVVRIADSPFLRDFVRLGPRPMMDFSFVDRCFNAIEPETWQQINDVLARQAAEEGLIDPSAVRTDTTVVEANIHYPTDSSLLWDSWRVTARLLKRARKECGYQLEHRFHSDKVKGLHLFVNRYVTSPSKKRQRAVRSRFRRLVERVRWIAGIAEGFCADVAGATDFALLGIGDELRGFLPSIHTVLDTSERAGLRGEKVPASERVFSIFEPHVELIQRGKRSKPVEFGHKIVLTQVRQKFISNFETLEVQEPDNYLTEPAIDGHKEIFGAYPDALAGDTGMGPRAEKRAALEKKVVRLQAPEVFGPGKGGSEPVST